MRLCKCSLKSMNYDQSCVFSKERAQPYLNFIFMSFLPTTAYRIFSKNCNLSALQWGSPAGNHYIVNVFFCHGINYAYMSMSLFAVTTYKVSVKSPASNLHRIQCIIYAGLLTVTLFASSTESVLTWHEKYTSGWHRTRKIHWYNMCNWTSVLHLSFHT